MMTSVRAEETHTSHYRLHMISVDDGTVLLGPLQARPEDADPVISVTLNGKTFWIKHSRVSPTPEQLKRIKFWAHRIAEHAHDAHAADSAGSVLTFRGAREMEKQASTFKDHQ